MCTCVNRYKEPYDIYIGRGTKWGNPFSMDKLGISRSESIQRFRQHLKAQIKSGEITIHDLLSLDGKRIACSCKPLPCHGDVIVEFVDRAKTFYTSYGLSP